MIPSERRKVSQYHLGSDPIDIFPSTPGTGSYVKSNTREVADLKVQCADFSELLPSFIDSDGNAGSTAVNRDFYACRTDNQPWRRAIPPLPDNSYARKERKLTDGWRNYIHRRIFADLAKIMLKDWKVNRIRVAKYSSSGFPFFTTNAQMKRELALALLPHVDKILTLFSQRRFEELYQQFQLVLAYRMGARKQADGWSKDKNGRWKVKERLVPELSYSLSNGRVGRILPADNVCPWDTRLALARVRSVYGLSNTCNLLIAMFFEGFNSYIYSEYPQTFKSHGPSDIEEKINRWETLVSVDVSNHDFLVPEFIMKVMFDELRNKLDSRVVDLIELSWRAPAYVPNPEIYGNPNPIWLGHPLNPDDFNHWYGIPSGNYLVSFSGKFGCMGVYLCKAYDAGVDVLNRIEEILQWRHPEIGILDMGDDAVVCFNNKATASRFRSALSVQDYYATGVEANGYLGTVFFKDTPTDKHVHVTPSPVSYVVNPVARERSLSSRMHPYWARGYEARQSHYRVCPSYSLLHEKFLQCFRDTMGYDYERAIRSHPNYSKVPPTLSWDDQQVIDDPDKIHYRADLELTPEVEAQFATTILPEEYVPSVLKYIHTTVIK